MQSSEWLRSTNLKGQDYIVQSLIMDESKSSSPITERLELDSNPVQTEFLMSLC